MRPLAIDLFCGLGGWTDGLIAEDYYVIGFDIEQHVYGEHRYPAQLVVQDVLSLHGSQFKGAALIVASPPCQGYSYRAMPWKHAKALPPPCNALFEACFRIQREACEAAGLHIPLIVENVRGAQPWVGRARWNYGSFYLWGDVPALMPITGPTIFSASNGRKDVGPKWDPAIKSGAHGMKRWTNPAEGIKLKDRDGYDRSHSKAFGWKIPRTSSQATARKMASAMIAKIPLPLSRYIAATFRKGSLTEFTSGAECGSSPVAVDGSTTRPRPEPAPSVSPGGAGSIYSSSDGGMESRHAPEGSASVAVRGLRQRRPRDMEAAGSQREAETGRSPAMARVREQVSNCVNQDSDRIAGPTAARGRAGLAPGPSDSNSPETASEVSEPLNEGLAALGTKVGSVRETGLRGGSLALGRSA